MASRLIYEFAVTIPAGTARAAATTTAMTIPPSRVDRIEVTVPPGPRGNVGFQLAMSNSPVIPIRNDQWVVTDNEKIGWDVYDQPDSGAWQLVGYNTGTQPHTIYVRFLTSPLTAGVGALPALLPASSLSSVAAQ